MSDLLLHKDTQAVISSFLKYPSHAVLITEPHGAGKGTLAKYMASNLLGVPMNQVESHPYVRMIEPKDGKAISIETVRDIIHFLSLKIAGKQTGISRIVIIEHAEALTVQAQNALLKAIEEPPAGTLIIFTAPDKLALLPTILSRTTAISLQQPTQKEAVEYFGGLGYDAAAVSKALLMSGGLVGLMHALLEAGSEHPMVVAANTARDLLQKPLFERLVMTDELAAKRSLAADTLLVLGRMAQVALLQPNISTEAMRRWQQVMAISHAAYADLAKNAQVKLVLLNFMLKL